MRAEVHHPDGSLHVEVVQDRAAVQRLVEVAVDGPRRVPVHPPVSGVSLEVSLVVDLRLLLVGHVLHARRILVNAHETRLTGTSVGTAQQPRSHADLQMPVDRVKADEAGDERGVEVVVTLHVLVDIPAELLRVEMCRVLVVVPDLTVVAVR